MKLFNKNYTTKEVFKNIKYLDPECLPRKFHYRDNELETIAVNMSPIFYGSVPIHTVIIGGNATGKTTAIKKLFNDIQEPLPEVIPVYINCRKHYTEYSVYKEIYNKVMNKKAPIRGSNSQKIFTDVMKKLEITRNPVLIALDDANYLLGSDNVASPHSQNIIRNLTRANESYNVVIGIYPIITSSKFKYKFDREVSTLFYPTEVHFHNYTSKEYFNIIKERCDYVFYEKIEDNVIKQIVKVVEQDNNIREAWNILKRMGLAMMNTSKSQEEILQDILLHDILKR